MKNTLTHEQRAGALGLTRLLKETADCFRHIRDLYSEGIAAMNGLKRDLETNSTVERREHRREIANQTGGCAPCPPHVKPWVNQL